MGMFGDGDSDEERLWKAHLDDSPMGMGMADYHDSVRETIKRLKEQGHDLSEMNHYEVRRIALDEDFKFNKEK